MNNNDKDKMNMENSEFIMPECEFCATCGSCAYYSQVNFSGYCNYHRCNTSSSDPACPDHK